MNENSIDAAKQSVRKAERRLADGWTTDGANGRNCYGEGSKCYPVGGDYHRGVKDAAFYLCRPYATDYAACLDCAESMGVYEPKCPCARMNLRDLSGDPVCYCTERPRDEVRVVGYYGDNSQINREYNRAQTGIATGLHMEARHKTATELACERASRRYPSTCDNEPSGA